MTPMPGTFDAPELLAEIASVVGIELCWTQSKIGRHPTYLLHTVVGGVPVLWASIRSHCRPLPAEIHCRAFRGTIRTEWEGGKSSVFGMISEAFLACLGFRIRNRDWDVLRNDNDHGVLAAFNVSETGSFQDLRKRIVVSNNEYLMRYEHLPPRKKILFNGHRIVAYDAAGPIATAIADYIRPERGRIVVNRLVAGIESVLAFLLMEARELERDTMD
jgi:hypothetical protein